MVDPLFKITASTRQEQQQQQASSITSQSSINERQEIEDGIDDFIPELYNLTAEPPQDDETVRLLSDFIGVNDLVIENKTSEPRDFLMTERTTLAWVKFSTTLLVSAIAITLNYRFDTSSVNSEDGDDDDGGDEYVGDKFKYGISLLFSVLSIACVLLGAYNYFHSIFNYKRERIDTYDVRTTFLILLFIIITLLIANVVLIVYD